MSIVMIKVTYESKLNLKQTIIFNAKQAVHDHGPSVVAAIDHFFEGPVR